MICSLLPLRSSKVASIDIPVFWPVPNPLPPLQSEVEEVHLVSHSFTVHLHFTFWRGGNDSWYRKSPVPCLLRFNICCTIKSGHLDGGQKNYFSLRLFEIFSLIYFCQVSRQLFKNKIGTTKLKRQLLTILKAVLHMICVCQCK